MNLEDKRRIKEGKYSREQVIQDFFEYLHGKIENVTLEEFVIVAKGTEDGDEATFVFSTTASTPELVGILEIGKLHSFDNRGDFD